MLCNISSKGIQIRNTFSSIRLIIRKKKNFQAVLAKTIEHEAAVRKVLVSSPGQSLPFEEQILGSLGTNPSCERIVKKVRRSL